jgi:Flp pilus assembly protein TadD
LALLVAVSWLGFRLRRSHPYILVGWLWFLGTLVPVLGLVQVGDQAMADRYTYVPLVGVFLALVWGGSDLIERWQMPRPVGAALVVVLLAALSAQTWRQVGRWSDTRTLFLHALEATKDNSFAHSIVATTFLWEGKTDAAEPHLRRSLEIDPDQPQSLVSLGGLLLERGDLDGAATTYAQAVKVAPWLAEAQLGYATVLQRQGRWPAAIRHYRRVVALDPEDPSARLRLAAALEQSGALRQAIAEYRVATLLDPEGPEAREALARMEKQIR